MIDKLAYSDVTSDTLFALDDASKGRVNSDNSITLTKSGPVTIIVIYKNTYQKLYINVTPPRVTSIHFSTNSYTLHAGETLNTVLSATYSDMTTRDVTNLSYFVTSNTGVAKIDENGVIKGIRQGTAT